MDLYHNGTKMEEFIKVSSVEGIKIGSVIRFEEGEAVVKCNYCISGNFCRTLFLEMNLF